MNNKITHIIPNHPNSNDGLANYASIIAEGLSRQYDSQFLVIQKNREYQLENKLNNKGIIECYSNSKEWQAALAKCTGYIFLHYSGYGYAKKGWPIWLARDLEKRLSNDSNLKIYTIFHEMEADTDKFSSAYFLAPLQKQLCSRLFKISDRVFVTVGKNYAKLASRELYSMSKAKLLPICSTIGEELFLSSTIKKEDFAIVFGTLGRRLAVYGSDQKRISTLFKKFGIKRIIDIGDCTDQIPSSFAEIPVEKKGVISKKDIRYYLMNSSLGLIEYRGELLGKSSIFAAYSAHKLPTLQLRDNQKYCDGIIDSINILSLNNQNHNVDLAHIRESIYQWYKEHDINQHIHSYATCLNGAEKEISRHKIALVMSQPTQNEAPQRYLANQKDLNFLQVLLTTYADSHSWQGDEYINKEVFDVSSINSIMTLNLKNISPFPRLDKFYGIISKGLRHIIARSDCIVLYGHSYISFWWTILLCKLYRKRLILTNDAIDAGNNKIKRIFKSIIFPILYKYIADHVLVTSTLAKRFITSYGVNPSRVTITPYTVDNELILSLVKNTSKEEVRKQLNLKPETKIALFCGKLINRKNPLELIRSFAKIKNKSSVLLIVGDGPLREVVNNEVAQLGITERVRMLGLVPYNKLPGIYQVSDVLVHPAIEEPFGLVVNEAFLCGTCVVTSDKVGSSYDLIDQGKSGFRYPSGDQAKLTAILDELLGSESLRQVCQENARSIINSWSPKANAEALCHALSQVLNPGDKLGGGGICES